MDERTEEQKIYDIALRSEKRTIGHRMSRKVLVIAPTHQRAQDWSAEHGIAYSDTIFIGPHNWSSLTLGTRGMEHVILGWAMFNDMARDEIKRRLQLAESVPFEGESVAELCIADPERV